jgi:cytochrome c biogenesis protein CcdA
MQELVIAALIGLSLGNSWLCLFMAFGMSTVELRSGLWFLTGRTIGLLLLGLIIIFAGLFLELSPKLMQGIAGLLAVMFGVVLVGKNLERRKEEGGEARGEAKGSGQGSHGHNPGNPGCDGGNPGGHKGMHHGKSGNGQCKKHGKKQNPFVDDDFCEIKPDIKHASMKNKRAFGFGLGVFRGITPCFKIVVLAPLLIAVPFTSGVTMIFVFTAVSMVYPLIGYLSASTLHSAVQNRKLMMIVGGLVLIIIGAYYIYEAVQVPGVHIPGTGGGV